MTPRRPATILDESPPPYGDENRTPLIIDRVFRVLGEQRYELSLQPAGIVLHVERLRRESRELIGELSVRITGDFPRSKTILNGILNISDMNLSSQAARSTRGKILAERSGMAGIDWVGAVEQFAQQIIEAERLGDPFVNLADVPETDHDTESWDIGGVPVLRRLPTVLLGLGGSGKSYLAMWIAGHLAQLGVSVAYLDWELAGEEHRARLKRLFQPAPAIAYLQCLHPLRERMDQLKRLLAERHCQFVVFDSVGPASRSSGSRMGDNDLGQEYFGLVRALNVGSLHVAHPPKNGEEEKDPTIYGSAFFSYLARSIWLVHAAEHRPHGTLPMALFHQKANVGPLLAPLGFQITFHGSERTTVDPIQITDVDELAAKLPLLDRLKRLLAAGPLTVKAIADELGTTIPLVWRTISRHRTLFAKYGENKIGLAVSEESF